MLLVAVALVAALSGATTAGSWNYLRAAPALLGLTGQRTYVVMFLNNAELRSLGGTALAFAEVSILRGDVDLVRVLPAGLDTFPHRDEPVIDVPDGFEEMYPFALGHFIANASLRPSAVTAAEIIAAEWLDVFGVEVDGVISMDANALAVLLDATGPIELSTGDAVSADNVRSLLFNEVYQRYNTGDLMADDANQNLVFTETAQETFAQIASFSFNPLTLIAGLRDLGPSGSFSVWFGDEDLQEAFSRTAIGARGVPQGDEDHEVVGVYLNDAVGAKLNYFLDSSVTTASAACGPDGRLVHRVTVSLTSTLAPGDVASLSPSIAGVIYPQFGLERGDQAFFMLVYMPRGSALLTASADGSEVGESGHHDEDNPVQMMHVRVPPGGTVVVSMDVLSSRTRGSLEVAVTPTLSGTAMRSTALDCATVSLP